MSIIDGTYFREVRKILVESKTCSQRGLITLNHLKNEIRELEQNVSTPHRTVIVFEMKEMSGGHSGTPRSQLKWERIEKCKGLFHQWGLEYLDSHADRTISYTVALIELENGLMTTELPHMIVFDKESDEVPVVSPSDTS